MEISKLNLGDLLLSPCKEILWRVAAKGPTHARFLEVGGQQSFSKGGVLEEGFRLVSNTNLF